MNYVFLVFFPLIGEDSRSKYVERIVEGAELIESEASDSDDLLHDVTKNEPTIIEKGKEIPISESAPGKVDKSQDLQDVDFSVDPEVFGITLERKF